MTIEPQRDASGQPQPFAETPLDPPGGCSRPLLVGCALAVVLAGLVLLVLLWKAQELLPATFRWALEQFEQQIAERLPEELTEAERRRLEAAFDGAATAVAEGTADPGALQRLQGRLMEVVRDGSPSREQVLELIEALEAVAAERAPPAAEPPPAAEWSPEPQAV